MGSAALASSTAAVDGDRRIRVAHMITPFHDAGADRQLLELLRRLDHRRYAPVLYLSEAEGHIVDELAALDLPVIDVGQWGSNERALRRLAGDLRRRRPHLIHSWMFVANTWARIAGRVAGVPVIITAERHMESDLGPHYRALDTVLAPLSTRVIVPGRILADHVRRRRLVPRQRIVVIPNGVDLERYGAPIAREDARRALDLPLDRPVVGMVASFRPRKRWDIWLDAVGRIARTRPLVALSCGDGETRAEMEARAHAAGLGSVVRFDGVRSDIPRVMAALDVLTLSSDDEGTPNVVLQAMASRRPAVATDAGATAEVIADGETGYVVPRRDPAMLAERVERLLADPDLAERFGLAGRRRVEANFTFEANVRRHEALYDELLARKGIEVPR